MKAWNSLRRLRRGLVVCCVSFTIAAVSHADTERRIAPERADALWAGAHLNAPVVVSSTGTHVAIVVNKPPAQRPLGDRLLDNGVPSSAIGNSIQLIETATGRTVTANPPGSNAWRPTFSPRGDALAFYSDAGGVPQLWLYDLTLRAARRVSEAKVMAKIWAGDEPAWSNDGQEIHVPLDDMPKQQRLRGEAQMSATSERLWQENLATIGAVNVKDGTSRTIVPASSPMKPSLMQLSPSGRWAAVTSVFRHHNKHLAVDLAVAPTSGGKERQLASGLAFSRAYDGVSAAQWHSSRDVLFWSVDGHLWVADFTDGEGVPRELNTELSAVTFAPLATTHDGRGIIIGERAIDDPAYGNPHPAVLTQVELASGKLSRLTLPEGHLFARLIEANDGRLWQPESNAIVAMSVDAHTQDSVLLKLNFAAGTVRQLWRGRSQIELTAIPAQRALVGSYEDFGTPANVYRFSTDLAQRKRLSLIEPRLDGMSFGTAEIISLQVPKYDGAMEEVTATVLLPPGAKRGDRVPLIVTCYPRTGFSGAVRKFAGERSTVIPTGLLLGSGYAVLLANSPLAPLGETSDIALDFADVVIAQVYQATSMGYGDIKRVGLMGHSAGGYATATLASRTRLFRAGVALSGVYDLLGGRFGYNADIAQAHFLASTIGLHFNMGAVPSDNQQLLMRNSPYYSAAGINTPLLITHGADDPLPVADARKMHSALRYFGKSAEYVEYPAEGHIISSWSLTDQVDLGRRVLEYFGRFLQDRPPAKPDPSDES